MTPKRLPAFDTCQQRGWGARSIIASAGWHCGAKMIAEVDRVRGVRIVSENGMQWCKTLPADVEAVTPARLVELIRAAYEAGMRHGLKCAPMNGKGTRL